MNTQPKAPAITLVAIGVIHSPFKEANGTPIQPAFAGDAEGTVALFPDYAAGLQDLAGFDRVWLLYWFDHACPARLRVVPFRDTSERGVFATRSPCRPNAVGLSCVRLLAVDGNLLRVVGVDVLDGTPLLDIKPYVPMFDAHPHSRTGWLNRTSENRTLADGRFDQ